MHITHATLVLVVLVVLAVPGGDPAAAQARCAFSPTETPRRRTVYLLDLVCRLLDRRKGLIVIPVEVVAVVELVM